MMLAVMEEAELILVAVIKRVGSDESLKAFWWEKEVAAAKAYLARVAQRARARQLRVLTEVVVGEDVAVEIAAYAGKEGADMIAIATHGRGGVSRALRGSIADTLTRTSRCSVLVFHPTAVPALPQTRAAAAAAVEKV
jgi:nucleotide-binding universal stress UspA family protein